ncbi:SprT-like domain-containing protein [Flammeovirga kamogawensis]|uniref:SprT-like domain-containing protein n=1 Tax=Flammeovirga kamogawensis TaxID=373891 RepID=A0ABX8GQG4_9BACT|nr:SprT-like domain-containing protein [Flammeovirga kamogawensis]MBB6462083.1 hypothetical protein [Flammeovirga kamogawensis]QWG05818.1 SprT-like domain-containing protein [Flammeovirga kamogawensis]TRX67644.1 sprT domain-containing protein [Flammeovirga kamogawensis]
MKKKSSPNTSPLSMTHTEISERLSKYTPISAATTFAEWILEYQIYVSIKGGRKSINGDYRPPQKGYGHRISINATLNQYQFAITFAHEVAHLITWSKYQQKVKPHGKEWKAKFGELLEVLILKNTFPKDLLEAIKVHQQNPSASSGNDNALKKALSNYDEFQDESPFLEDLIDGDEFSMEDGRVFIRNKKLRKYFLCTEKSSGKQFRINSLAKVNIHYPTKHDKAC